MLSRRRRAANSPVANRLVRRLWHIHRSANVHQEPDVELPFVMRAVVCKTNRVTGVIFDRRVSSTRRVSSGQPLQS